MQNARMLGNYVEHLMSTQDLTRSRLGEILGCDSRQVDLFLKGRAYVPFQRIQALAKALGTSVSDLLAGDVEQYNASVVHCMNDFQDPKNRELVLDLIDDYVDVLDAVTTGK